MKRGLMIALGVFLVFVALWGGAYVDHAYPWPDWRNFPAFMTAAALFCAGLVLVVWAVES